MSRQDLRLEIAVSASAHVALDRRHAFDGADFNVPLTVATAGAPATEPECRLDPRV